VKIQGKTFSGPDTIPVVIPRSDGDVVFKAQAVLDFSDFDALCPVPEPPGVIKPGNVRTKDPEDADYLEAMDVWAIKRTNWMILKSLDATEGLEWETVDKSDPETWDNFRTEMQNSGFTIVEVGRIIATVTEACGLNQDKIDEATERFLAAQAAEAAGESSLKIAP
jgi:hypothetical protein